MMRSQKELLQDPATKEIDQQCSPAPKQESSPIGWCELLNLLIQTTYNFKNASKEECRSEQDQSYLQAGDALAEEFSGSQEEEEVPAQCASVSIGQPCL
jgi:hypothetical protein